MAAVKKFMFDRDFDLSVQPRTPANADPSAELADGEAGLTDFNGADLQPPPVAEAPPEAPTFSEEELAAAREEAFQQGKQEGLKEAAAGVEQHLVNATGALAKQIAGLFQDHKAMGEALTKDALSVSTAIVRKLMPRLLENGGTQEIESMVETAITHLRSEPSLAIRLSPDLAEKLQDRFSEVAGIAGFEGTLRVIGDPAVAAGDCSIEWGDGGVERKLDDLWGEIEQLIEGNIGQTTRLQAPEKPETPPAQPDAGAAPEAPPATASDTTPGAEPVSNGDGDGIMAESGGAAGADAEKGSASDPADPGTS